MLLSLITKGHYQTLHLPERVEGKFIFKDTLRGEELFEIFGNGSQWTARPCGINRFVDAETVVLQNDMMLHVRVCGGTELAWLYAEEIKPGYAKYARCMMPDNVELTVGMGNKNDLHCLNRHFSAQHCKLVCRGRVWSVQDLGSETGTFVNGSRIHSQPCRLRPGDVVSVLNQRFVVLPGILALNAQSVVVEHVKKNMRGIRVPKLPLEQPFAPESDIYFFHRQLRFTTGLMEEDFTVNPPPSPQVRKDQSSALLTYGPAVTSGLAMLLGGMMNPITGISMLAGSLLWPKLSRKHSEKLMREEEKKRQQRYSEYLSKMESDMQEMLAKQEALLRKNFLPLSREVQTLLRDNRSLWNRRKEHLDFLSLRLGSGDIPAKANIRFPDENEIEQDDPMIQRLRELAAKPRALTDVPIILELSRFYSVGIAGPEAARNQLAMQLISQLAIHIGYDDLTLCLLGRISGSLDLLRWLPHTWDEQRTTHYIAGDSDEVDRLTSSLDSLLAPQRQIQGRIADIPQKEIVFLITEEGLANSALIRRMLFEHTYEHVHVITLVEHSANLPSHANSVAIGIREKRGRMKWQAGEGTCQIDFAPDTALPEMEMPLISMLANTRLEMQMDSVHMPSVVPFLDMFNVHDTAHLNLLERWENSDPMRTLRAPIGVGEDGNLCMLDLHEKGDGPHGLVAGTTGSGKSELLMSYILSAAICYSPEEIAFVLIDYKGGGMAQAFAHLPHTTGIITNLDGNEITRSLMSIESELQRRQRVFSDTEQLLGCRKLDIYGYQRFYREKKVTDPLPHLIIITDEFAELKTQQPEFLAQLIRAARIGRSLGVHLILATQKPAGVVDDQIWSNSNFRLCLRVQNPSDSQDVLKCPDAAMLTNVGSLYKQVGYGETMIKVQSAWTGANYSPDDTSLQTGEVSVLDHNGEVLRQEVFSTGRYNSNDTQLDAITDYIKALAQREGTCAAPLWQPVLEAEICLSDLRQRYAIEDEPWVLNPVMGEIDDPANQRRLLLRIPLSEGRNTIVYGAIGSGKAMFLTTLMEDLLHTHTPEQLHVYILDYADDGLQLLGTAPHVGDVLFSDEDEKFMRLLRYLQNCIADRKKKLGGAMSSLSLAERLERAGMSHILVILHHLVSLQQRQEEYLGELSQLMSEGPHYGISFIATEESSSGLRFQLQRCFAQKYVLQMDQDDDYMALLGRTGGFKPAPVRGRGLLRDEGLYEFQTATADEDIAKLCETLRERWKRPSAVPIRVLPERVDKEDLLPYVDSSRPLNLPIGVTIETIENVYYPFDKHTLHLILGSQWDVAALLHGLLPLFTVNNIEVVALDPDGITNEITGVKTANKANVESTIVGLFEQCIAMKQQLSESAQERKQRIIVIPTIKGLRNQLSKDVDDSLTAMLEKARSEWNWTFLVCGTAQELATMRVESWYRATIHDSDGIFLGAGAGMQNILQINGNSRVLNENISYPIGYVVEKTNPVRVKFVDGRV